MSRGLDPLAVGASFFSGNPREAFSRHFLPYAQTLLLV